MRINRELKEQWVGALRSGLYEQTQEVLRDGNSYCCLGVLCDLIDPFNWTPDDEIREDGFTWDTSTNPEHRTTPPFDIELRNNGEDYTHFLTRMQDGGMSFSEIADYIDQVFEEE